jgi:cell wall-associated NlpC family hydrolase
MPNRREAVRAARRLVGSPFVHQGRSADGIDCVGLIIAVARALGLGLNWPEMPYREFPPEDYVRGVLDSYLNTRLFPPEAGDVALIRWRRTANHLAIIGDGDEPYTLIHAYYVMGRVVEHRADPDWQNRIVALYTFRGIE